MREIKELPIQRDLNEETRKQGIVISGVVYSLHMTCDEVIITDNQDYSKIYSVQSLGFFNAVERDNFN